MANFEWLVVISLFCLGSALPASKPFPMMGMDNVGGQGTMGRFAILAEYALSGKHNVRWETSPMKYLDAQGKPMSFGMAGGSNPSPGCVDVLGKTQPEGTEYERPSGHFKYICKNGQEEVTACVASDRANKAKIAVGQTLEVNGFWHKCESHPNGSVIYSQETSCATQSGKEYRVGEEINVGFLRLLCQEHGYKVVGCYYLDDNKNPVSLNSGEQREAGKVTHVCEEKGDTLQYYAKMNRACTKQGKEYKEGDTFKQNHLNYKCSNGMVDVTGCYITESRDLPMGQDVVENQMVYRCYRLGGKIEYNEYACGFNGTPSCKPEPIPQTPDDVPQLGRGLISPGFGSFSVVQHGGEGEVVSPSNVNLQLDKTNVAMMRP